MSDDSPQLDSSIPPAATTPPVAAGPAENRFAPERANLFTATLGAVLGAAIGATCWLWLAHNDKPNLAWGLGILLGGFSGYLAAWLGRGRNSNVGAIAALVTAVAIAASAYSAYSIGLHSNAGRQEYQMKFAEQVEAKKVGYSPNEYELAFEAYLAKRVGADDNPKGFIRWMGEKGIEAMVPILMMLCGVCFAFLVAGGKGCVGGQCRQE